MTPNVLSRIRRDPGLIRTALIASLPLVCAGCEDSGEDPAVRDEAAVELWTHPDTVGIEIFAPVELKAASRDVAWGIDRIAAAIMRFEPRAGEFGVFGFLGAEPTEVAAPMRLAVTRTAGVVAYDDSTGMVDFYTPGGQHVRGFDPGIRPAILEVARSPLRLTFGSTAVSEDSVPRLVVIQTDFLGENRDTLLTADVGPETLRGITARAGNLTAAPSESGLWLYAREVPDTVFEVAGSGPGRKMVLPEADTMRVGVIADLDEQILWLLARRPEGGLDYEAFDVSSTGAGEVIEGGQRYLGARTTPQGFVGKVAAEGAIIGWWNARSTLVVPRAYDMRLADLRAVAEAARAARGDRRRQLARNWELLLEEMRRAEEASEEAGEPAEPPAE